MAGSEQMMCCGVNEVHDIRYQSALDAIKDIYYDLRDAEFRRAFLIFTDHHRCRYGQRLAKFIHDHKLGKTLETRRKVNPNTGNHITVWIWDYDRRKLQSFAQKQGWKKEYEEAMERDFYQW